MVIEAEASSRYLPRRDSLSPNSVGLPLVPSPSTLWTFYNADDLNELLIRAAGDNRSAFIRNAIKLHILAKAEDEKLLTGAA